MASLHARSSLRSTPLLLLVNKLASLSLFLVLLAAGWMAVSYLRAERSARWINSLDTQKGAVAPTTTPTIVRLASADQGDVRPQAVQVKLMYSCPSDRDFYHASAQHLPSRCERTALTEDAAVQRGLKACPKCVPQERR
jgi:hypothetical protein